jgi:hypothetical protein
LLDGVYVRFAVRKRGMYLFVDDGDDIIKTRGLQLSLGESVSVGALPFFRKSTKRPDAVYLLCVAIM